MKSMRKTMLETSCYSIFDPRHQLLDLTEKRLIRMFESCDKPTTKLELVVLLKNYRDGEVAVAWKKGKAVYVKLQNDLECFHGRKCSNDDEDCFLEPSEETTL